MSRRNNDSFYSPYFFYFILSLVLLLGNYLGIISILRYPFELVLIPPRRFVTSVSNKLVENSTFLFSPNLKQKIIQMEEYKRELEVLKQKIQLLEEENNTFRTQLETPLPPSWNYVPAYVLGSERYLIIDKGTRNGVAKDMPVLSENIIIGKIFATSQKTSRVQLLWDPDAKVSVKTNKNVRGLLTGSFGNKLLLSKILQKEQLNNLDVVLTSGEEGIYPANLIVGKVDEVSSRQEDVYKQATVVPLISYEKLNYVFVLVSN